MARQDEEMRGFMQPPPGEPSAFADRLDMVAPHHANYAVDDGVVYGDAAAPGSVPAIGSLGSMGSANATWTNFLCLSSHPVAATFHILFKSAAFALYLLHRLIGVSYVMLFVSCVLLLAADFWAVKNVTGRLLVGLRWWVHIREDGSNEWLYESSPSIRVSPLDGRIFWAALLALAVLNFLSFSVDYLLINVVAITLTGTNLWGYMKCSSEAQRRLQGAITSGAMSAVAYLPGAIPAIGNTMMNMLQSNRAPATAPAAPSRNPYTGGAAAPAATGPSNPYMDEKVVI